MRDRVVFCSTGFLLGCLSIRYSCRFSFFSVLSVEFDLLAPTSRHTALCQLSANDEQKIRHWVTSAMKISLIPVARMSCLASKRGELGVDSARNVDVRHVDRAVSGQVFVVIRIMN